jgi:predicted transcriptional regulator
LPDKPRKGDGDRYDAHLTGTTYSIYRYMVKRRTPVGVSEVQKELGLSSSSVSQYHLKKLEQLGLIREDQGGYVIDKVILDNVIRIRRVAIPSQTAYATFFGSTLVILVLFLRPPTINSLFFFALVINCFALAIASYEAVKTFRSL